MSSVPSILLLARSGSLSNETELTEAIRIAGYPLAVARSIQAFSEYLEQSREPWIVALVQQWSVLEHARDIEGYKAFLRAYAQARLETTAWRHLALFMITAPSEKVDWMIGGGDLVTCYLWEPVNPRSCSASCSASQKVPSRKHGP